MRTAFATACLGLVTAVACSSGSSGSGPVPASTVSAFGQDYCGLLEPCCAQAGLSTTGMVCEAFVQLAAGQGTYDAAAGQACISGMQAESGSSSFCTSPGNDVPACSQVFNSSNGTEPPGAPCQSDTDCAKAAGGGAHCYSQFSFGDAGSTQTQTCVQTLPGQAGDGPCIGTQDGSITSYSWSGTGAPPSPSYLCDVAGGTTCDATTSKCTPLAAVGQPCTSDSSCVAAAYCAFGATAGQCTARLADGASCAANPAGCATTSTCDAATSTCKALLADGSPCSGGNQCASHTCVNQACGSSAGLDLQLLCGTN
jgi:hypothetical protein